MAYNNNPAYNTYKTQRFSFIGNPQARDGLTITKDQRFVNCFAEVIKSPAGDGKKYYLRQRPGVTSSFAIGVTGEGRGLYYWNSHWWTAVGNQLYKDTTPVQTLGTSTGTVGFTEYNGTYDALIILDGVNGWVVKTDNTITQITDPDFPTPHLRVPAYLDGYLFVVKSGTPDIYNSDLNDPLSWTSGNFITAEMYPEAISGLAKNNNYICAVGTKTVEFFYDAGIASGSPLATNSSALAQMGSPAPDSISSTERQVVFVGATANGGFTVWTIDGFKATEVGIEPIRQALEEEGTNIANAKSWTARVLGHKFYILNLTNRTFAYDFEEQMWHEWASTTDTQKFLFNYAADHPSGRVFMLHPTSGQVYYLDPSTAVDMGVNMTLVATSIKIDFDNSNRKTCSRFTLVCDNPNPGTTTSCTIQWSDDDYYSWSTGTTLSINGDLPSISQLGQFRRRAFKLTYNAAYPLRLEGFELDVNIGQQ